MGPGLLLTPHSFPDRSCGYQYAVVLTNSPLLRLNLKSPQWSVLGNDR